MEVKSGRVGGDRLASGTHELRLKFENLKRKWTTLTLQSKFTVGRVNWVVCYHQIVAGLLLAQFRWEANRVGDSCRTQSFLVQHFEGVYLLINGLVSWIRFEQNLEIGRWVCVQLEMQFTLVNWRDVDLWGVWCVVEKSTGLVEEDSWIRLNECKVGGAREIVHRFFAVLPRCGLGKTHWRLC